MSNEVLVLQSLTIGCAALIYLCLAQSMPIDLQSFVIGAGYSLLSVGLLRMIVRVLLLSDGKRPHLQLLLYGTLKLLALAALLIYLAGGAELRAVSAVAGLLSIVPAATLLPVIRWIRRPKDQLLE